MSKASIYFTLGKFDNKHDTKAIKRELDTLPGVRDVRRTQDTLSFLYGGDMHDLLAALAGGSVQDLSIAEPDLEEIFLHYYQEEA